MRIKVGDYMTVCPSFDKPSKFSSAKKKREMSENEVEGRVIFVHSHGIFFTVQYPLSPHSKAVATETVYIDLNERLTGIQEGYYKGCLPEVLGYIGGKKPKNKTPSMQPVSRGGFGIEDLMAVF